MSAPGERPRREPTKAFGSGHVQTLLNAEARGGDGRNKTPGEPIGYDSSPSGKGCTSGTNKKARSHNRDKKRAEDIGKRKRDETAQTKASNPRVLSQSRERLRRPARRRKITVIWVKGRER